MFNPIHAAMRAIAVLIIGLVFANHTGYFDRIGTVPKAAIQHVDGHQFLIRDVLRYASTGGLTDLFYSSATDTNDDPGLPSQLGVRENGRPLGPAHSMHQDIADQGNGLFSDWTNGLRFSTSDNSDPRTNDRTYSIVQHAETLRLIALPALAFILLAWLQRRRSTDVLLESRLAAAAIRTGVHSPIVWYAVTGALGCYIICCYVFGAPPIPLISPDSTSYWFGYGVVPIGYPVFLWTIYGIFGTLKAVVVAQIIFFVTAILALQSGLARLLGPAAAGLVALLIMISGAHGSTTLYMLSESVFISLILFHLAAASWAFARPTRLNLTLLALTAVACLSVRPAGYFVSGGIFFLALFWSGRRLMVLRWAVCPLILFLIIYYSLGMIARNEPDQSNLGANLFPHTAHLYDGPSPDLNPDLAQALDSPVLRSYQRERKAAHDWLTIQGLEQLSFNLVLSDVFGHLNKHPTNERNVLLRLSLYNIRKHPVGYAETVLQNLNAWFVRQIFCNPPYTGDRLLAEYRYLWDGIVEFQSTHFHKQDLSFEDLKTYFIIKRPSDVPFYSPSANQLKVVKIVFVVTGVLAAAAFMFGYPRPDIAMAAYTATLTLGGALLVSLSTVFIPRYAIPLDPLVIATAALGICCALITASKGMLYATRNWRPRPLAVLFGRGLARQHSGLKLAASGDFPDGRSQPTRITT
jgi:hypothetical protein